MRALLVVVLVIGVAAVVFARLGDNGAGPGIGQSRMIEMTAVQKAEVTQVIQSAGYNCPRAALAHAEGVDTRGTVVKVWCGPADREGVYENAIFRVTFVDPGDQIAVRPWQ